MGIRLQFGNGMGMRIALWESHGNGNKTQTWEWEWEGMGINCMEMGIKNPFLGISILTALKQVPRKTERPIYFRRYTAARTGRLYV